MSYQIFTTQPSEFTQTVALEKAAFATADHADGTEHILITKLRNEADYQPDFDIVAKNTAGVIVGHAMLSAVKVVNSSDAFSGVYALAPIGVSPDYQGQGIGTALIKELEHRAKAKNVIAISILGNPLYYQRFGYEPAANFNIFAPFEVPSEYFMLKSFNSVAMAKIAGTIQYAKAFEI